MTTLSDLKTAHVRRVFNSLSGVLEVETVRLHGGGLRVFVWMKDTAAPESLENVVQVVRERFLADPTVGVSPRGFYVKFLEV